MEDGGVLTTAPSIDALNKLAPALAPGGRVAEVTPLSGGASQELWSITIAAAQGSMQLVLRRAPEARAASAFAIPIEAEARLVKLAHARGVPTPDVVCVLNPGDGLGRGYIMSYVDGEALGGRIVHGEGFAQVRPLLARQCGEILARIHALPAAEASLPVKQPPQVIDDLEAQYRIEELPRPVFELAFRWLRARVRSSQTLAVVHGDFRTGNLLIGPEGVSSVLDWELAHIGDPMSDLGWLCVNSWRFGAIDKPVGGFGAREELYAGYELVAGAPVDQERARFWEVLGTLRWGVICTLSAMALRAGGPAAIERPMIARRASETELDLLNLMREQG